MTQGPRSADQARRIDPSGDRPARAVGLRLHARETRFGTSGLGFGTPSRGGVMHRHCLSTAPPATGSRAPQGLAASAGSGRRVVTSRSAASDDARSVARKTPTLAAPPRRTTVVARTEGKGTRVPVTPSPRVAGRKCRRRQVEPAAAVVATVLPAAQVAGPRPCLQGWRCRYG